MASKRHPQYTFVKNGYYYFTRLVPQDLRHHYDKPRLVQSLKTKSRKEAASRAKTVSSRLEQFWFKLRMNNLEVPMAHLLSNEARTTSATHAPDLKDALELYLTLKGTDKNKNFSIQITRAINYFIKATGKKNYGSISTKDASIYRDWLLKRGLKISSVHRYYSMIRSVTSFVISEQGLEMRNPFAGLYLPAKTDSSKRIPIKGDLLIKLQQHCILIDDDIRHLLAIVSDSGMRLGEAVGLLKSDLKLDGPIPHVIIQMHKHRRLKTGSSTRIVPLVGLSLWAAKRVLETNKDSLHCFPRYSNDTNTRADSASATFAVWLKKNISAGATVHGLRHGFRDRLRDAKVPTEAIDQMGGWSKRSVGAGYGDGYGLEVLFEFMQRLEK